MLMHAVENKREKEIFLCSAVLRKEIVASLTSIILRGSVFNLCCLKLKERSRIIFIHFFCFLPI